MQVRKRRDAPPGDDWFALKLIGRLAIVALLSTPAFADDSSPAQDGAPGSVASLLGPVGNFGGLRDQLAKQGVQFGINAIGEVWQNASGGVEAGGRSDGRVLFTLDIDFDKLAHWTGATAHASAVQIGGSNVSRILLANLMGVSSIDDPSTFRLFEVYFQQSFSGGKASLRIGQLAADSEFAVSDNAALFLNSTFGWPALFSADLPGAGPAYPLATPGVRLEVQPFDHLTARIGFFNGDPAPCCGDPQIANKNGVNFLTNEGLFVIGEAALTYGGDGPDSRLAPGTFKLGAWYNSDTFSDLRFDMRGLPLASPDSTGVARRITGDSAIYGILDQAIWRKPGEKDRGIGLFVRLTAAPGAQNELSLYADAGLNFKGLVPRRPADSFGVALGYAEISTAARGADRDIGSYSGAFYPVRSRETVLEATYSAEIVPGWTLQPDFQYIWNPGGGVLNPRDETGVTTIRNAAVFGLRTAINF